MAVKEAIILKIPVDITRRIAGINQFLSTAELFISLRQSRPRGNLR